MITQGMKCETQLCGKLSTWIIFIKGKVPAPRYCDKCAEEILKKFQGLEYRQIKEYDI